MSAERIIGVDFGTSTSVIRVKRYENGEPIGEKLETKEVIFNNSAMFLRWSGKRMMTNLLHTTGMRRRRKRKTVPFTPTLKLIWNQKILRNVPRRGD